MAVKLPMGKDPSTEVSASGSQILNNKMRINITHTIKISINKRRNGLRIKKRR